MEKLGLYIILTNPVLPHTTIAEKCVAHGIRMLQLREKNMADRKLFCIAKDLRAITRGTSTQLVINDRADIALACDADYLHLGQDDLSIEDARKMVGDMKIGLSTHSIRQAHEALIKEPDYIGFGPVYPTNAKVIPDAPLGTDQLKEVIAFSKVPVVAIGGIFPENLHHVIRAGAENVALVRHFMQTSEFDKRVMEFKMLFQKNGI